MTDKFQRFAESVRPQAVAAQPETPKDDPAQADGYRAIRRVRTFDFPDVWFTDHTGTAQAFQWAHVRRMMRDGKGTRLSFVWADAEVTLTGKHLDKLEEDIQRRVISEFFQVTPGGADKVTPGDPVITTMRIGQVGEDAASIRPPGIALIVPGKENEEES